MRRAIALGLLVAAGIAAVGAGTSYIIWGAVTPCAALAADVKQSFAAKALNEASQATQGEAAGLAIALAMTNVLTDSMVAGLTPIECARGLWRRYALGEILY